MEADKVHTALQAFEHPDQRICMSLGVIEAGKHRILEADSSLTCKVILFYQVYDFLKRPCSLSRHDTQTLRSERIVEADGKMALALVKILLKIREDSYRRKGDSLRTPSESPVSGKDLDSSHHIVVVVKRLSHSHEDRIRKPVGFVHSNELRNDVRC